MTIAEQTRPLRAALGRSDRYTDLRGELGEQLLLAAGPAGPAGHERDAAIEKHRQSRRRARPSGCAPRRFTAR